LATSSTLLPAPPPAANPRVDRRRRRTKLVPPSLFPDPRDGQPATGGVPTPPRGLCPSGDATKPVAGIARLALSSPLVDEKRQTEYYLLPVKSLLNRCTSERVPFPWTVNPYRGCEFGCRYCYARYTHEFMELDPADFERKIYVKAEAGALAARDLASPGMRGQHIAIGTATDPYQPAEEEFGATRAVLEAMARETGLSVSITTKSNRVVRDIDLLRRISERSSISVNLSVTTLHQRLARRLEPRAPRPDLRLAAVTRLREAGIAAGVFAMPILPGITDRENDLDALARSARDAGAQWISASVLFLMPSSLGVFLPFLEKEFPKLARRYREWYTRNAYAPETYRKEISERFAALRAKYGLGPRPTAPMQDREGRPQMELTWSAA
jgi:DNA repair photolyase